MGSFLLIVWFKLATTIQSYAATGANNVGEGIIIFFFSWLNSTFHHTSVFTGFLTYKTM